MARTTNDEFTGPRGDESRHLPTEDLERLFSKLTPPRDRGELALIVSRDEAGTRHTPQRVTLTPEGGVPGDTWLRKQKHKPEAQLSVMRIDVCRMLANGQDVTLAGDNLLVDLDLSDENLPCGSRVRLGGALLEVTPEPHDGCLKFKQRFGQDALRMTATHRPQHLRGIYMRTIEAGEVAVGDTMEIVRRGAEG